MYLIEHCKDDCPILEQYPSIEEVVEAIKSYQNQEIKFKVFYALELTNILI